MSVVGTAYSPWLFWDGRADSQWAQALGPLENALEHGGTRAGYAHLIAAHYRAEYEAIFGALPDLSDPERFPAQAGPVDDPVARAAWEGMRSEDRAAVTRVFVNMGKAIAAYERRLIYGPSRFDAYVTAVLAGDEAEQASLLSADELAGLRLFIGTGNCTDCHNGPLLTNNAFHNTGVPGRPELALDDGRATGVEQLLGSEFTCLGPYSDAEPADCGELRFMVTDDERLAGAFRVPSLRNVAERAPYMHAGQLGSLRDALAHYNTAPAATIGHSELEPLRFTDAELRQIEAFLRTLSGPLASPDELLRPP
jgi:cytochrome c peroxidase